MPNEVTENRRKLKGNRFATNKLSDNHSDEFWKHPSTKAVPRDKLNALDDEELSNIIERMKGTDINDDYSRSSSRLSIDSPITQFSDQLTDIRSEVMKPISSLSDRNNSPNSAKKRNHNDFENSVTTPENSSTRLYAPPAGRRKVKAQHRKGSTR